MFIVQKAKYHQGREPCHGDKVLILKGRSFRLLSVYLLQLAESVSISLVKDIKLQCINDSLEEHGR